MTLISIQIWCNQEQKCIALNNKKRKVTSINVIKRYESYIKSKYPDYQVFTHYSENPNGLFGQEKKK